MFMSENQQRRESCRGPIHKHPVRLVWRSDVHVSDTRPASRTDDWNETLMGKLVQVGEIAREVGATAVLDGGDFFHVKSPKRNSHRTIQRVAQIHKEYPCPTYGNIGNHDCIHGDYKYLPAQPLGVLFETGVFKRCYDEFEAEFSATTSTGFGYPIAELGTPEQCRVRVVGIPYHGTKYDMERFTSIKKGDEDFLVVMAHVLASPGGGTMYEAEDVIKYSELAGLDPDVWCFGHWHRNQGIQEIAPGKHVVNIGSLSRGALTTDEMSRIPAVAILDFSVQGGVQITQRELEVVPAEDVFNVEGRTRSEAKSMTIDSFIEKFRVGVLETEHDKPLEEMVRESDAPDEVRERAVLFLEKQGSGRS